MEQPSTDPHLSAPLGYVEPHAGLLRAPPDEQSLYKIDQVVHLFNRFRTVTNSR